jgi:hypothetical protein
MDTQSGNAKSGGQTAGKTRSHQQSTSEAGPSGVGDTIEVAGLDSGLGQCGRNHWRKLPHVIARRDFWHHPAVAPVAVDLAIEVISEESALAIEDRDSSLVAGCFYA